MPWPGRCSNVGRMRSMSCRAGLDPPLDDRGRDGANATTAQALIEHVLRTRDFRPLAARIPQFRVQRYRKGQALLDQGAVWRDAFCIDRGIVRIHRVESDGKDYNRSFWAEGMVLFPITAEMEERASVFAVTALEDCVVLRTDIAVVRDGLDREGLWEPLRTELLRRLLSLKQQREYDLLSLDGASRYRKFCAEEPALAARVPLAHLASYLGLTDVSLSRIRRRMKQAGA